MITFLFSVLNATQDIATQTSASSQIPTFNAMQTVMKFLPFILIALVFYFFIIRPQNQQRKQLSEMINNLQLGDKIITKGGIIGIIESIEENSFIIKLHDGTKIETLRHAIISTINGHQQ